MKWTNYHTHSQYCDGKAPMREFVEAAIEKGMYALGFSGHSPVPFASDWNIKQADLQTYLNEVEQLKQEYAGKIKIYKGLEIDFIPGVQDINTFDSCKLDYCIGGVHYLIQNQENGYWSHDNTTEDFATGLQKYFHGDIKAMITKYYRILNQMVTTQKSDVISHLDVITKFNQNARFFSENEQWYKDLVEESLQIIRSSNQIVEVNTRGYFKKLKDCFYPNNYTVKRCFELGIPMTINADAHHPSEVTSYLPEAAQLLWNTGYRQIHILDQHGWRPIDFTPEKGLLIE